MKHFLSFCLFLAATGGGWASNTWNGGGAPSNTWSNGANWAEGAAPTNGASLIFDGTANTSTQDDLGNGFSIAGITFNATAGAFSLSGNSIKLTNNITDNSANVETINNFLTLSANRTFSVASGGSLVAAGNVSGAYTLTKSGAGSLTLSGSNSFTNLTVGSGSGSVLIGSASALGSTAGTVTLGSTLGFSTSVAGQVTAGTLALSASSIIDFGSLGNDLKFLGAGTWNGTLSIYNWNSAADQLFFGSDNSLLDAAQLGQINFYSGAGTGFLGAGAYASTDGSITFAAAPEPSSLVLAAAGAAGLLLAFRRRALA